MLSISSTFQLYLNLYLNTLCLNTYFKYKWHKVFKYVYYEYIWKVFLTRHCLYVIYYRKWVISIKIELWGKYTFYINKILFLNVTSLSSQPQMQLTWLTCRSMQSRNRAIMRRSKLLLAGARTYDFNQSGFKKKYTLLLPYTYPFQWLWTWIGIVINLIIQWLFVFKKVKN